MKTNGNTLSILRHFGGRTNMTRGGGYPILLLFIDTCVLILIVSFCFIKKTLVLKQTAALTFISHRPL